MRRGSEQERDSNAAGVREWEGEMESEPEKPGLGQMTSHLPCRADGLFSVGIGIGRPRVLS